MLLFILLIILTALLAFTLLPALFTIFALETAIFSLDSFVSFTDDSLFFVLLLRRFLSCFLSDIDAIQSCNHNCQKMSPKPLEITLFYLYQSEIRTNCHWNIMLVFAQRAVQI